MPSSRTPNESASASASESERGAEVEESLRALVRRCFDADLRRIEAVEAGLGTRRFARLHFDAGRDASGRRVVSAIARIDAPEDPRSRPAAVAAEPALEPIRAALEAAGLPVPARYGADSVVGIELLEDLGDLSLERAWPGLEADAQRHWIDCACALIPRLQRVTAASAVGSPEAFDRRLDRVLFAYKAEQLIEHGLPFARERSTRAPEAEVVRRAFDLVAREAANAPQRLAHRDFKAANLHLRVAPAGEMGTDPLVMIDLQGAFLAPPEYDLVCLLRDLQIRVPDAWIPAILAEIGPRLPDETPLETLERRFTLLTLSRVGKDLSRYALTWLERADPNYGRHLPHAARMLGKAAEDACALAPEFARLADLLEGFAAAPAFAALQHLDERRDVAGPGNPPCAR